MAFSDSPIIDRFSQNSEKSERRMMDYINQETGFICRKEVPDKGCDFDVELILNGKDSSSWKFPIQLKSIEKLQLVDEERYISYSFETSRLGYLMRRIPAMGIIVLYSIQEDKCFYEFADRVYNRLTEERESDKWKDQDSVNIHVPYTNLLTTTEVANLHRNFVIRFEQALKMQNSHGPKYGLPTVSLTNDFEYDFHNLDHVKKFLVEYGISLLNNYDLDIIYRMIITVPNMQIYGNKDLLLVAVVSYTESGLHAESMLFCNKLSKFDLNNSETLLLDFVLLKNNLALGYIDEDAFLERLEKLNTDGGWDKNKIVVQINIIRYRFLKQKALIAIPESIRQSIDDVFDAIERTDTNTRMKGLLTLWNGENLFYLITTMWIEKFGDLQIRESLGNPASQEEVRSIIGEINQLERRLNEITSKIDNTAVSTNDKYLKAYSSSLRVKAFIHSQINYVAFDVPVEKLPKAFEDIRQKISESANAFTYFNEINLYKEAYECVCNMIELIELAENWYHIAPPHDKKEIYQVKEQMESTFELPNHPIAITGLIDRKNIQKTSSNENKLLILKDLNDMQINSLAEKTLASLRLPKERLLYIVNEMNAYRTFYQRCTDPNIKILQLKNVDYQIPTRFVLRSMATGVETLASSDMDKLLIAFGF